MDAKRELQKFYQSYDEEARLASRCGKVEYVTTMHYIQRFLKPGMRILELGAGTGRYSHALARQGYSVDAVELIEYNIQQFRQNTQDGEPVTIRQGDATDLSWLEDDVYDLTLILGPMYHLFDPEDQRKALREAVRVTRPGGVLFAAYCMADPALLSTGFVRGKIQDLIAEGLTNPVTFQTFSRPKDIFQLYRKEDIDALWSELPVTQLAFAAADGLSYFMRETIETMEEDVYRLYLDYHLTICERPDMVGWSHHTLDIFRKNEGAAPMGESLGTVEP